VPRYSIFTEGNGGPLAPMLECNSPGMVGGGGGARAGFISFTNPSGKFMHICIGAGTTGEYHTTFNETPGATTTDGTVVWQNIGAVSLPIGGWPGGTPAAAYFPQDRGQTSVQHMLCRARAKLRKRARAVEISFETRFEVASQLSCRMNGLVYDTRLPGGQAWGKVISYKLEAHGDSGVIKGSVVLGCSIGTGDSGFRSITVAPHGLIFPDPGIPSYVNDGYVARGYQRYNSTGTTVTPGDPNWQPAGTPPAEAVIGGGEGPSGQGPITPPNWPTLPPTLPPEGCPTLNSAWISSPPDLGNDNLSYSPPVSAPNDDGITFPAAPSDLILQSAWHGIAGNQAYAIYNLQLEQIVHNAIASAKNAQQHTVATPGTQAVQLPRNSAFDISVAVQTAVLHSMMQGQALWYELVLKPLTNGPFSSYYIVDTSDLQVPLSINLSAPSSGGGLLRHA
jgi:hypothetical protein